MPQQREDRRAHPGSASHQLGAVPDGLTADEAEAFQQRRLKKRVNTVAAIKTTPEYQWCLIAGVQMPATPRADDQSISKRAWESSVMEWRRHLSLVTANIILRV